MGDVRLRQLRLYDGRHHGRLQRVFRADRRRRARAGATFAWTFALSVELRARDSQCADHRRLRRRSRGQEEAARDHDVGRACSARRSLSLGRSRRSGARVRADRLSNVFFGTGENIAARVLARARTGEAMGKVSAWGWSLGYYRRLTHARSVALAYVIAARAQGQTEASRPVTMLITAGVFALAEPFTFSGAQGARASAARGKGCAARAVARRARRCVKRSQYQGSAALPRCCTCCTNRACKR